MVSNAPISPHTEVFNTYGASLSNAQLLARYGFALEANEHDIISWTLSELPFRLPGFFPQPYNAHAALQQIANTVCWPNPPSELVYFPTPPTRQDGCTFCINGDARVSVSLWAYAVVCAIHNLHTRAESVLIPRDMEGWVDLLEILAREQVRWEALVAAAEDDDCENQVPNLTASDLSGQQVSYSIIYCDASE